MKKLVLTAIVLALSFIFLSGSTQAPRQLNEPLTFSLLLELLGESSIAFYAREDNHPACNVTNSGIRILLTDYYSAFTVYEFENSEQALQFTSKIGTGGMSIHGAYSSIMFQPAAPVHWFIRDNIIVLYIGDEAEVVGFFQSIFGRRFAGVDMVRW